MRARLAGIAGFVLAALVALPAPAQAPPQAGDQDISGTYSFVHDGETLQLNLEDGRVDGWVTRFGEDESDKGQRIDQFFDKAALRGDQISFTTKVIHGVWFDFQGTVARGPAKSRSEEGYFVIRGTLRQYTTDASRKVTARERQVEFRLFPEEVDKKSG
ncbi:MAG TPA: hypothetical protein VLT85_00180 [Terriglobales bacterium]|nr:hypothetical protein [Terriglobales bacterium]